MGPTPWAIMEIFTLDAQVIFITPLLQVRLSSLMDTPLFENGKSQSPPLLELEELLLDEELEELLELEDELLELELPPVTLPKPMEPLQ